MYYLQLQLTHAHMHVIDTPIVKPPDMGGSRENVTSRVCPPRQVV